MAEPAASRRRHAVLSVRTRIVAAITLVAAVGLLAVGATVYVVEHARILESLDERLEDNLASARYIVENGDPESGTWTAADDALQAVVQRMSPDDNTGALGIIDGRAVMVPGVPLDLDLRDIPSFAGHAAAQAADGDPVIGRFSEHGVIWQYLAAPIAVSGAAEAEKVVFAMAYDVSAELSEINEAAQAYVVTGALALVLVALAATIVSTRLLRPLRRMRETAERISAQSLSERLPVQGRDDVSDLAATMNDMLDRLDDALDSQRRLLSDVGHELKTPLTIVRGHLEVLDPHDPTDVTETRALTLDELERMARLVQDLADAASLHGASPVTPRRVDAGDLLHQIIRKAEGIDGARVTVGPIAEVIATIDPARVTQAVLQLVQNAVTHGGGSVVVGSRADGRVLEISVRDHGPGVPDGEKAAVFERFHRGGDGRGGSGLGLNIVQVIARAHGGSVGVGDADGGGAVFTLRLPDAIAPRTSLLPAARFPDSVAIPPKPPLPASVAAGEE